MSPAEPVCPVCALPAAGHARCPECDWTLRTGWRQGPADRTGFAAALQAARLEHDLAAAARADDADWRPCAAWLRGVPDEAAWTRARALPGPPPRPLRPLLAAALDGVAGRLAVFEADAEGVALTAVWIDEQAANEPPVRHSVSWPELLPELGADPALLRFRLAGGLADRDRAALDRDLRARLEAWAAAHAGGAARIAVCRAPGWTVPERAAALLAAAPARDAADVAAELAAARAALPLRRPYGLLMAEVDPRDRAVRLVARPLFAAGARAGAAARTTVRCAPGGDQGTVFAVVADGRPRRLVSAWSAPLRPGEPADVEFVLEAPGRVRPVHPAGMAAETRGLAELERLAPARLDTAGDPVELICLLELNGPRERALRRRELLGDLLGLLAADAPGQVTAAVLGYGEHYSRQRDAPVLHGDWLRPPAEARDVLAALPESAPNHYKHAAPLEDALHAAADHGARDRSMHRRVLLVLAGRPAHPAATTDVPRPAQRCPGGLDWMTASVRLAASAGVVRRCAVLDVLDAEAGRDPLWRDLGRDHLTDLASAEARPLAVALGLVAADPVPCPFPLA